MTPARANTLCLLAAVGWGTGNVAQKVILEHLDGFSATGLTSIVGAIVLLPLARREARHHAGVRTGSARLLIAVSVLFTLATTLSQFGFGSTSVSNAGFLINSTAAITPILAWACLGQRLPAWGWIASLCAMAGAFLMGGGALAGLNLGDGLCLLAACAYAIWTLLVGQYVIQSRRPILMTTIQLTVCGVACIVMGAVSYGLPTMGDLVAALPEIIGIGVISKGLAFMLLGTAQQHVSASGVAVLSSAESIFGALAALALLGETMRPERLAGAACITLGLVLTTCIPPQASPAQVLA